MSDDMKLYVHDKTGNYYILFGTAVDCTNSRDGAEVAVYARPVNGRLKFFVRDIGEFRDKFTESSKKWKLERMFYGDVLLVRDTEESPYREANCGY